MKKKNVTRRTGKVPSYTLSDKMISLVAVPPSLVKALDCFSDDPAVLYAWRDGIADCLDE